MPIFTSPVNNKPVEVSVIFRFTEFEKAVELRKLIPADRRKEDVAAIISALLHNQPILVRPVCSRSTPELINSLLKHEYIRVEKRPFGDTAYYIVE